MIGAYVVFVLSVICCRNSMPRNLLIGFIVCLAVWPIMACFILADVIIFLKNKL